MATPNRSAILTKAHKILKKHYTPATKADSRPLLEQLVFAACLDDSSYDAAETAYARLQETYFDWNEVRVSSVSELAETLTGLYDPTASAWKVKHTLHSVFESNFSFDLEVLKRENIGKAADKLLALEGITPFAVAYVTQHALGGHAIPLDDGALQVMHVIGAIDDDELAQRTVPGMERAIPKAKGIEFGSILHQLGAEYLQTPHSPAVRAILVEIDPDAKDRLPKRKSKKSADEDEDAAPKRTRRSAKSSKRTAGKSAKSKASGKGAAGKKSAKASPKAKSASSRGISKRKPK